MRRTMHSAGQEMRMMRTSAISQIATKVRIGVGLAVTSGSLQRTSSYVRKFVESNRGGPAIISKLGWRRSLGECQQGVFESKWC